MAASAGEATFQAQDDTGALLVRDLQQAGEDNEEEWEYEYSATETETYYLTIELSYPEFKERALKANYHSRGGYYRNWLDPEPDTDGVATFTTDRGNLGQEDDDNDDEPLPEPDADDAVADDAADIDPRLLNPGKTASPQAKKRPPHTGKDTGNDAAKAKEKQEGNADDDEEQTEDIQILELHSHNPLISYRGRVFEGQWAEVIGTEAILANREANDAHPLPALRNLPGDVDLLAASSSRILTTERRLKPKVPAEDLLAPIRQEWNIRIPTGKDRTGERAQQTRFLENLMALKKKKGETDHVTVYARDGKGKNFKDNKDPDARPRRRKTVPGTEELARQGRRRTGRPRGSNRRGDVQGFAFDDDLSMAEAESLSTPTPRHWEDLSRERGEDIAKDGQSDGDEVADRQGMDVADRVAHEQHESDHDETMAD